VGRNILIFSDATGQAGGFMPDEARSNVYKLYRATRVSPDTDIDPRLQIAFYDPGLGSAGEGIRIVWWRHVYNLLARATGLGITQSIIDCYAAIIRVWQPGDRIYLFGFSRGAYAVRCVGGVLKYCGVPTAVRGARGSMRPLERDAASARRIATEAVKHVYQYGSSVRGDRHRAERERRARQFRAKYVSGDEDTANTAPYCIGVWDTVASLGAGTRGLVLLAGAYAVLATLLAAAVWQMSQLPYWSTLLVLGLAPPLIAYLVGCVRCRGLLSLARYRMAFYDTKLHYAVRYARHALSIDENRRTFRCIPWDDDRVLRARTGPRNEPARCKQVWFAGNHCDIGGSYPETESRLSDIALAWMVQEAMSLPQPVHVDHSLLRLHPDFAGMQHDERRAFLAACPNRLRKGLRWVIGARNFGWREGLRQIAPEAELHPSVRDRFELPAVLIHGKMAPYRPRAVRNHVQVMGFWAGSRGVTLPAP
jgi:uncharacterized protein (DUF2235 family)